MARHKLPAELDIELAELPQNLRWREWMGRVEAVIFASPTPVGREVLARIIGQSCNLDALIDDIGDQLRDRPYELVAVAGGWHFRTRKAFAGAIQASGGSSLREKPLSQHAANVLMAIACFQPVNRGELGRIFGTEISRDTIASLRAQNFIASGPRSPQPGAPYTFVTTPAFLAHFGLNSLRDLPDMEMLEDSGLLSKEKMLGDDFLDGLGAEGVEVDEQGDEDQQIMD